MLCRCAGGGVGFAGDDSHGVLQGAQLFRENKGTQAPATGTRPLAKPGADNRAFRIVACNRFMPPLEVYFSVDLVGKQDEPVFPGNVGNGQQLVVGVSATSGVG